MMDCLILYYYYILFFIIHYRKKTYLKVSVRPSRRFLCCCSAQFLRSRFCHACFFDLFDDFRAVLASMVVLEKIHDVFSDLVGEAADGNECAANGWGCENVVECFCG